MGNSQTSAEISAKTHTEGVGGGGTTSSSLSNLSGSIRRRRRSKVKVLGLLDKRKATKEAITPPTASDLSQVGLTNVANTSSVAERIIEYQKHDAVVRQRDFEQMEMHLSSSTDSLCTGSLTPPQSTNGITAAVGSTADLWSLNGDIDADSYEDDDTNINIDDDEVITFYTSTSPSQLAANPVSAKKNLRSLSDISIASAGTSVILSPTTTKQTSQLQKRHQSDNLSQLSISKASYCELLPTGIDSSSELETGTPDEEMALHLGKKLAQVLSGGGETGSANEVSSVAVAVSSASAIPDSPMQEHLVCCNAVTGTNELFNIAKAKRIELPSLSSRLVATAPLTPTSTEPQAAVGIPTGELMDAKHLPALQSTNLPSYTSLPSTNTSTAPTVETQSTVIISFKSSQTPLQSQPLSKIGVVYEQMQQQQQCTGIATASSNKNEIIPQALPHTPSLPLTNSSHTSTTSQMGAPKNNVLKKVVSFTIEKSATGSSSNNKNSDSLSSATGQLDNAGSKHLAYVPEKLNFAAYDKFEGRMLIKWLISSLQNTSKHLSEQDINMLTLQYCNNLISVGVLKQISEKNYLETFKPFQMYQWAHTEAPTSHLHTPGKLDKVTSWPFSSTPPSGVSRAPKAIQVDTPQTDREINFLQGVKNALLNCSSVAEVHDVVNDMLPVGEPSRCPSKRCSVFTDIFNGSEISEYQYEKSTSEVISGCERGFSEAGVQTDESATSAVKDFVCCKCRKNNEYGDRQARTKHDKATQVYYNEETGNQSTTDSSVLDGTVTKIPSAPPVPTSQPSFTAPPPPPPPPSLAPPPPPPLPSLSGPPPPPSKSNTPSSRTLNTSAAPPPPPPESATKHPLTSSPAPLPNPAEGGWFKQANTLRKVAVNPPKPMKPLYWTRIVTQPPSAIPQKIIAAKSSGDTTDFVTPSTSPDKSNTNEFSTAPKEIWQEIDETHLDNIEEFTELFSREAIVPKVVPKTKTQSKPIKILDSKRSQNVGILLRSSHVDFCEIEHAISHVDTSVVSLETLQQINKNKATNDELERIKEQGETQLDEPEQFLLKISQISMFGERISCMVFMAEFEEITTVIERKLEVVLKLSQFLMKSEELKLIFTIILTLGNYMNGGNRQRGQADGFTLEILSKLKDVKSKDSQITLLHFIVRTYIARKRKEGVQLLEIPLPIPEPSDVERATQVDFDEINEQITKLKNQLNATEKMIKRSSGENIEPFKSKMEEFVKNASKEIDKLFKALEDCSKVFIEVMTFYHYVPKSGTLEQCTPNKFFEHWTNFTNDFKDIMKKEIALLWNDLLKKAKNIKSRRAIKTTKVTPGCLKERMLRLQQKRDKE